MVALAVPTLGGVVRPSLAPAMLRTANEAYLAGHKIEATAKLREALRRHLSAQCDLYRLDKDGTPNELLERLRKADVALCCFAEDVLVECDDILALRSRGETLWLGIDWMFELVGNDLSREGGAI